MSTKIEQMKSRLMDQGIYPVKKIDLDTLDELYRWILSNRPGKKEFIILINSPGGCPNSVINFASLIKLLNKEVTLHGIAVGECGSAALALLQCCTKRSTLPHTGFFIHHMSTTLKFNYHDPSVFDRLKEEIEQGRKIEAELISLQCKRSGMSKKQWKKLAQKGEGYKSRAILPTKALSLGLVDEILDEYPIL